jgi:tRNA(Arg) A34 adenosine deaminase TadA
VDINRIIKIAVEEAKKSSHKIRMGAVIFHKKKVLSKAHNIPNGWRKRVHPRFKRFDTSLHCEVVAIHNAKTDLRGSSLLVVRINRKGELRLSKPCFFCQMYIDYVGINMVYYINEAGNLAVMD